MRKTRHILLWVLATVCTVSLFAVPKGTPQRLKARYYYLEGARRQALGEMPEAYEYYKKAWLTDPTYPEAASAYGTNRLVVQTDTMQSAEQLAKSLNLMRTYVDAYPSDLYESRMYAFVAGKLDSLSEAIRIYERIDSIDPSGAVNLIQLSDAYMANHQQDKALEALDRFEVSEGKSPQLSMKKMSFMLAAGDTLAAVREADELIKSNPREPSYRILKGNLYEVIGNNDSILASYLDAERIAPTNGAAKIALASYYKDRGDSVAYDNKVYEALLSEDFMLEEKLGLIGEYLQTLLDGKNDTSRGDHLFDVILEQYPHEPKVLDMSARYSAAKGNFKEACEQIGYAIDLDSSNPDYWTQLMRYELADERGADAMATYDKAIKHVTPTENLTLMYASAASEIRDYDTAEKAYAELIHEVNPSLPLTDSITDKSIRASLGYDNLVRLSTIYNMLGDTYYTAGNSEKAYKAYDNSLYFYPSNPMTLNNYAYFLTENGGDLDKALEMIEKTIEQVPDNDTYLDTYAWVLFKRKEYKKALEYQMKAMEAAEAAGTVENVEFYSHMGDILFMNSEPEEALENWKKALKLSPDDELLQKKVKHKTFFYE